LQFVNAVILAAFLHFRRRQDERSNLINVSMLIPIMGVNRTKAFRRSRPRFQSLRFAISRRRVCYQRFEEMMCDVRNVIYRAIGYVLVCFRRFGETAQLADELQR
jgi:hypothetical protein